MGIETKTARAKLAVTKKPYYQRLGGGVSLGYRRNVGVGTWVARISDGARGNTVNRIALADDGVVADGITVLSYLQACDAARRSGQGETADKPIGVVTLRNAIDRYAEELARRGGDKLNVTRIRKHLTPQLAARPLALMDNAEFRRFRDGLAKKMATASVDRTCRGIKAACNLAAETDATLNPHAWTAGLALIKEKSAQRHHVPLPQPVIAQVLAAARAQSIEFGNLVQVLAETGCRYSQAARILICDLLPDDILNIPVSRKGRGTKAISSYQLPISGSLAARLRVACGDRPVTEPLLLRPDGKSWAHSDETPRFRDAIAAAGQDTDKVSAYSLRHSWIIDRLLKNVPGRLVAANADTSLAMLERTYSRYIRQGSEAVMRAALQNFELLPDADVIQMRRN